MYSVSLIWNCAAVVHRAHTEETGTFLMGPDFHSLVMVIYLRIVMLVELIFVVLLSIIYLVYIAVTYQQVQFM